MEAAEELVQTKGALLHVERAGEGPTLVLIPGGGGDAAMYEEVVPLLAGRFTVITLDRRGNSRSRYTEPDSAIGIPDQAGDVVAILDHYGIDRAYVFGSSGGAVITVELVARHADRLLGAVAHEPPLVQLLPDDSAERRELDHIFRLCRDKGPMRAFAAFGAMTMPHPPWIFRSAAGQAVIAVATRCGLAVGSMVRRLTGREPSPMTRMLGNAGLNIGRELPEICFAYRPDLTALRTADVRWCTAVGDDSTGRPYHRPALVLAERVGVSCERFPGGHMSYQESPEEFTTRLTTILDRYS
ncbi:alpha/beta hydrolase [Actinoallomurus purpureus]|uniref:alpha/beta fold hydrolase n=1 Tax=Actinoallomurus purpureus TaxID=478114 RepID=UPI0020923FF5|nr:alpha/beta hydrolase [Actinoallomurus purpureus]MCO6007256.1 alpha/beta hydrolase [Actinoallomurus purpureus]